MSFNKFPNTKKYLKIYITLEYAKKILPEEYIQYLRCCSLKMNHYCFVIRCNDYMITFDGKLLIDTVCDIPFALSYQMTDDTIFCVRSIDSYSCHEHFVIDGNNLLFGREIII